MLQGSVFVAYGGDGLLQDYARQAPATERRCEADADDRIAPAVGIEAHLPQKFVFHEEDVEPAAFVGEPSGKMFPTVDVLYFVKKDDIVLDFFSGSGTTAHAAFNYNLKEGQKCQTILVQFPENLDESLTSASTDAKKTIKVAIDYLDSLNKKHFIPEIAKERIRRAGKKIKEESPLTTQDLDTGFRVFRVDSSNYEEVEHTPKDWNQDQLDLFLNNIKSDRTDFDLLFGCILDWGVQLSLPMTTEEVDGKIIYTVNEGDLVACFADKVTDNVVRVMAEKQPLRVIFRDSCFERDADKINIYETFKQLLDWSDQEVVKNIRVI